MAISSAWQESSLTVGQFDDPVRAFLADADGLLRREDLRAEAPCLGDTAARQISAAQAGREAQVVFDARTEARLAAGGVALDDHGVKPLGRAIDSRRPSPAGPPPTITRS